jgi:hypothetical protein
VAVRVQIGDEPEVGAGAHVLERADDGRARAFVSVDTADDEHGRTVAIPDTEGDDRSTLTRPPERDESRGDGRENYRCELREHRIVTDARPLRRRWCAGRAMR